MVLPGCSGTALASTPTPGTAAACPERQKTGTASRRSSGTLSRFSFPGRLSGGLILQLSAAGFITGLVPYPCICTGSVRGLYRTFVPETFYTGRMSDVLFMHRLGAVASVFLVCLSRILFVQLCRCVSFTPRGGGQRDRERFANLSLSLQHLSTHSGESLRRGITANRVVCINIGS